MNSDQLAGKWKQLKGAAKEQWGKLTNGDLDVIDGKQEKLQGRLQERYGITKEAAAEQIEQWCPRMQHLSIVGTIELACATAGNVNIAFLGNHFDVVRIRAERLVLGQGHNPDWRLRVSSNTSVSFCVRNCEGEICVRNCEARRMITPFDGQSPG